MAYLNLSLKSVSFPFINYHPDLEDFILSDTSNIHSVASTSASLVQKNFKYDVFLSFRGEDTRKTFVDHLYHALQQKGIITFKDDERIEKGERISDQLIRSIEESRFYIIVFSKNYASSSWCLDELLKIMECHKKMEHTAYPVFYDVEPTEVRNQIGAVREAFAKHVENEAAGRWIDALKKASDLAGWELKNTLDGHEAKVIQQIVQEFSLKLHFIYSCIDGKLVGMETRVKKVVSTLEIGSDDVRIIGIKGMGGGGKTTLARAVFDLISIWFEGISFVENVREVSKRSGMKELQKQVLKGVLNDKNIDVTCVSDGQNMMKRMMPSIKVLLVLDDVDDINQLEALAGELTWFKPGSRIIITTRDSQVLVAQGVKFIHDVNLLSDDEAICLFSKYAFKRNIPNEGYEELSDNVVRYAAGLPLTIKVLGSHLCGRSAREWEDALKRLKKIPEDQTLKRLELSYNGLENDQKEIFLDVVCILKGEEKNKAIRILESCGFNAIIGLSVLEQKSLITVSDHSGLGFHDHIEEMGWNIVRRLYPNEPSRHSRIWIQKEIEDVLINVSGTEATRSIRLQLTDVKPTFLKGLRKMNQLRLLYVHAEYGKLEDNTTGIYLPDALQSLCWHRYPFPYFVKTFKSNKLVKLGMWWSSISQPREVRERKVLNTLRFLDLSYSKLKTFDLRMTPHLEVLNLEGCWDFVELQLPVECPNLKFLNLRYSRVSHLNLGLTPHLMDLDLQGCSYLQKIYAPVGCLKNLVNFCFSKSSNFLDFKVEKQHESANLDSTKITVFCEHKCPLHPKNNLPKFGFTCIYDEPRCSWSGNLEKLFPFGLCACKNREYFSAIICGLHQLRELTLEGNIPNDEWSLESLKKSKQQFKHLPYSICMLKNLKSLKLYSCLVLEQLPENICRLERLEVLDIWCCQSLRDIPNSICKMKCLKRIKINYCFNFKKLPEELGSLQCLKELWIEGTCITRLPQRIYQLKGLRIYGPEYQLKELWIDSYGFTPKLLIATHLYFNCTIEREYVEL